MLTIVGVHCRTYVCFSPKDRSVYSNIQAPKKELSPVEMASFFFLYDFLLFAGAIKLQ
jgi:hypothetical protein